MSRFFIRVEPEADSGSRCCDSESCRDSNTPRAHGVYRVRFFTCSPPELRFLGSDCSQQTCGSWHSLTIRIVTRRLSSAVAAWHPACLRIPSEYRILVAPPNSETRKRGPSREILANNNSRLGSFRRRLLAVDVAVCVVLCVTSVVLFVARPDVRLVDLESALSQGFPSARPSAFLNVNRLATAPFTVVAVCWLGLGTGLLIVRRYKLLVPLVSGPVIAAAMVVLFHDFSDPAWLEIGVTIAIGCFVGIAWIASRPLWGCQLPVAEVEADLPEYSEAAGKFRRALVKLWTTMATFEVTTVSIGNETEKRAARASLASRVRTQIEYPDQLRNKTRCGWLPVQNGFDAWWRPTGDPNNPILLAMRYTLSDQLRIEIPGVTDQRSLRRLAGNYGALDDASCVTDKLRTVREINVAQKAVIC